MKTYSDIDALVKNNLDKEIKYSKDRVKLVEDLLNDNSWIIDLISSEEYRGSQVKSKKDPLSTNSVPDKIFEKIADYILFPKFEDEHRENKYNELNEEHTKLKNIAKEINKLKKKECDDCINEILQLNKRLDSIKKYLDSNFNKKYLTVYAKKRNKAKEDFNESIDELDSLLIGNPKDPKSPNRMVNKKFDIDLNMDYWINMGFSLTAAKYRQEIIDNYENDIRKMRINLGYDIKDADIRNKFRKKIVEILDKKPIVYEYDGRTYRIDGFNQFRVLRKMYADLVSSYKKAKESLVKIVEFQSVSPSSTVFDYNSDTYYLDKDGNTHEVSKNHILFSDINTYKGLINNYADLKFEYSDKFNSDMWAILHDFEDIIGNADLNVEEKFVICMVFDDYSQKEILYGYESQFGKSISLKVISTWINRVIPRKLLNAYLDSVDEWLYTYKIKGKYKKCSKCGEVKLISNDRYFRKDKLGKNGFRSQCRKCELLAKKGK